MTWLFHLSVLATGAVLGALAALSDPVGVTVIHSIWDNVPLYFSRNNTLIGAFYLLSVLHLPSLRKTFLPCCGSLKTCLQCRTPEICLLSCVRTPPWPVQKFCLCCRSKLSICIAPRLTTSMAEVCCNRQLWLVCRDHRRRAFLHCLACVAKNSHVRESSGLWKNST